MDIWDSQVWTFINSVRCRIERQPGDTFRKYWKIDSWKTRHKPSLRTTRPTWLQVWLCWVISLTQKLIQTVRLSCTTFVSLHMCCAWVRVEECISVIHIQISKVRVLLNSFQYIVKRRDGLENFFVELGVSGTLPIFGAQNPVVSHFRYAEADIQNLNSYGRSCTSSSRLVWHDGFESLSRIQATVCSISRSSVYIDWAPVWANVCIY